MAHNYTYFWEEAYGMLETYQSKIWNAKLIMINKGGLPFAQGAPIYEISARKEPQKEDSTQYTTRRRRST